MSAYLAVVNTDRQVFQSGCNNYTPPSTHQDFPSGSDGKASVYNVGDLGSIPGLGRSPGEGNGNPLQYYCLENPMDSGAWQATVHGITKSQARLCDFTSLSLKHALEFHVVHSLAFALCYVLNSVAIVVGVQQCLIIVLICISLMTKADNRGAGHWCSQGLEESEAGPGQLTAVMCPGGA